MAPGPACGWCAANDVHVVFMTRNPLDLLISTTKHHENPQLNPHCHTHGCLEAHRSVTVQLPTGGPLLAALRAPQDHFDVVRRKCKEFKAKCFEVRPGGSNPSSLVCSLIVYP